MPSVHATVAATTGPVEKVTRVVLEGTAEAEPRFIGISGARLNEQQALAWAWATRPREGSDASPLLVELWFPAGHKGAAFLTVSLSLCKQPVTLLLGHEATVDCTGIPVPTRARAE